MDDVIQWSGDLESPFFRICNMLSHCSKAGMVFSPEKVQFAMEEVEFAGFMVGKSSIRTTEKYKQAIMEFPAPQSISDVRSWFGLINQVAYSFSMSSGMTPFRPLLSPSSKFHWNAQLQETS